MWWEGGGLGIDCRTNEWPAACKVQIIKTQFIARFPTRFLPARMRHDNLPGYTQSERQRKRDTAGLNQVCVSVRNEYKYKYIDIYTSAGSQL